MRRLIWVLITTCLLGILAASAPAQDVEAARDAILAGVEKIHGGNQPGRMIAYGPTSFAVGNYAGGPGEGCVIAAAAWGEGRVVAVPDHQMLNMDAYGDQGDSGKFYTNALTWLAQTDAKDIRVASTGHSGFQTWLAGQGYTGIAEEDASYADLQDVDVLIGWMGASMSQEHLNGIAEFVKTGGGLFLAEYGVGYSWWWNKPISDAPGNMLLRDIGIAFPGGNRWETELIDIERATEHVTEQTLLEVLHGAVEHEQPIKDRAANLMDGLYATLPPGDALIAELDVAFGDRIAQIEPTPATPVKDLFERALLRRELAMLNETPVEDIEAHRTAEKVFGEIPVDAPRVKREVTIDTAKTRWHSTGLYAAPGDQVIVKVPEAAADKGFAVQISGHTDDIGGKGTWLRMPRVARRYKIEAETTTVASPFGGALYIDVGGKTPNMNDFDVTIDGAIEAPYFVLGETTDEEWANEQRTKPAPYAELCSEHLIFSMPKSAVEELDGLTELMTFWDEVVAFQDDLAGHGYIRTNAERINIDVQISAGGAHAGYPAQGPGIWGINDIEHLHANGSWGWFHELGHETQRRPDKSWGWNNPYTFDGSIEATVNIFSVYTRDMHGIKGKAGWGWTTYPPKVMGQALTSVEKGGYTKVGVGQKLAMFLQIRDGFGWDAWKRIFLTYDHDAVANPDRLPTSDAEKRDEFLIRASESVEHNLTKFMRDYWGLELGQAALDRVAGLPDWMPAIGGIAGATIAVGDEITLDLQGDALSLDDRADVVSVGQPTNGTVTGNGDGTWTYAAEEGFEGEDSFTYGVVSSTGHEHETAVAISVRGAGAWLETWNNIAGGAIADLTGDARFPDNPDDITIVDGLEAPANRADNFGARMRAILVPPTDGDYTFWIASDDAGELLLSTDEDSENAKLIAEVGGYSSPRAWDATPEQKSEPVALTGGQRYYIEARLKEGGGNDHLSVAWEGPDIEREVVGADYLRLPGK